MSSPICDIVGKCGAGQLPLIDLLAACVVATWTKQNPEPKKGLPKMESIMGSKPYGGIKEDKTNSFI